MDLSFFFNTNGRMLQLADACVDDR